MNHCCCIFSHFKTGWPHASATTWAAVRTRSPSKFSMACKSKTISLRATRSMKALRCFEANIAAWPDQHRWSRDMVALYRKAGQPPDCNSCLQRTLLLATRHGSVYQKRAKRAFGQAHLRTPNSNGSWSSLSSKWAALRRDLLSSCACNETFPAFLPPRIPRL